MHQKTLHALHGLAIAALLCYAAPGPAIEPAGLMQGFERARLSIATAADQPTEIRAYVARTAEQRARGLMHVRAMDADEGMLFIYPGARVISMWMKNTYIPLDMLFADSQGRIVHLHAGAIPHDTRIISSVKQAALVLELNAGSIETLGIAVGDRIKLLAE